jgi:hypothetical protein
MIDANRCQRAAGGDHAAGRPYDAGGDATADALSAAAREMHTSTHGATAFGAQVF